MTARLVQAVNTATRVRMPVLQARAVVLTHLVGGAVPYGAGGATRGAGPATVVVGATGLARAVRHTRATDIGGAQLTGKGAGPATHRAAVTDDQ